MSFGVYAPFTFFVGEGVPAVSLVCEGTICVGDASWVGGELARTGARVLVGVLVAAACEFRGALRAAGLVMARPSGVGLVISPVLLVGGLGRRRWLGFGAISEGWVTGLSGLAFLAPPPVNASSVPWALWELWDSDVSYAGEFR